MYYIVLASIPDRSMKQMSNKALVKIHNEIFLNHQIKNLLRTNQKAKIFIICAFESKKILEQVITHKRVSCIDHEYTEYSNIGESIKTVIQSIPSDEPIGIINLSMIIEPKIFKSLKLQDSSIITSSSQKFKSKIGCTLNKQQEVEFVFYDLPNKVCEFLYISKKDNLKFKRIISDNVKNNMYLFEIINMLIKHDIIIKQIITDTNVVHFNSLDQLPNIKNLFRKINNASLI